VEQIRILVKEMQVRHDEKLLGIIILSAGIVRAGEYKMIVSEMLRAADKALYAAKQAGRHRIVIFETNRTGRGNTLPQVAEANIPRLVDVFKPYTSYD